MDHPQKNDAGQTVLIERPSNPTNLDTWSNPAAAATVIPGGPMPAELNGLALDPWIDAPTTVAGWNAVEGQGATNEPPFAPTSGKHAAAGVVVEEPDGRFWLVHPTKQFGGYSSTFPKGRLEPGICFQAAAIKEAYEESGLKVELTGWLLDTDRTKTRTRYFLGRRVGGNPACMGWESQASSLVPRSRLAEFLSSASDAPLLAALSRTRTPTRGGLLKAETFTSGHRVVETLNGYRRQFGKWPTKILMPQSMAAAIRNDVLTSLGWLLLTDKLEVIASEVATVTAEGRDGSRFEYDGTQSLLESDGASAEQWIWGVKLTN